MTHDNITHVFLPAILLILIGCSYLVQITHLLLIQKIMCILPISRLSNFSFCFVFFSRSFVLAGVFYFYLSVFADEVFQSMV